MPEADWEHLTLDSLGELGWRPLAGDKIAPGSGERDSWDELLIRSRPLAALQKFTPPRLRNTLHNRHPLSVCDVCG